MNTKRKDGKEVEAPAWLVNWMIRERVWRWRVSERLRRWAARELPWRLRFYFVLFLLVGGLGCTLVLIDALDGRYKIRLVRQDSLYREEILIGGPDTTRVVPRLRYDAILFWSLADSIDANPGLRRKLDSVLRSRPGLADSLRRVKDEVPRVSDGSRGARDSGTPNASRGSGASDTARGSRDAGISRASNVSRNSGGSLGSGASPGSGGAPGSVRADTSRGLRGSRDTGASGGSGGSGNSN